MEEMSEQLVIKHEDFTEDSDVHKSIDSIQHEQYREYPLMIV